MSTPWSSDNAAKLKMSLKVFHLKANHGKCTKTCLFCSNGTLVYCTKIQLPFLVCGGNYFTSAGVIKSPGYPEEYPPAKECIWIITVQPGQQILLNVTSFDLEGYTICSYDFLEIR